MPPLEVSQCCNAPVRVEGRTTQYYVCMHCGQPCDVVLLRSDVERDLAAE